MIEITEDVRKAVEKIVEESDRFDDETMFVESAVFQMIDLERSIIDAQNNPSTVFAEPTDFENRHLEKYEDA